MSNKFWQAALASPALLGLALAGSAFAAEAPAVEAIEATAPESVELAQITGVDELSDVLPSDWAYTALQNLVNTYGCIEGYPNRTFRGNQPLTRYEFAAGLNACLDVISQLIGTDGAGGVDLATIQRLQQEFAAELATLRGRVDALEAETAELRAQQFSTTTKLRGQVDAHIVVPFGDLADNDDNTTFSSRARLNFDTSFTGEDRLRVRLQASDDGGLGVLSAGGGLANASGGNFSAVRLDDFYYSFPVGSRLDVIIAANSIVTDDFVTSTIVPFDGPSVADPGGPVSYDFDMGGGGFAAGFNFALTDNIVLDAGYSAGETDDDTVFASNNPNAGGIFGAQSQSYIAQLSYLSDGLLDAGIYYMHGDGGADGLYTDTYGGALSLDFGAFLVGGYFAFHEQDGGLDDESYQFGVAFPDLFIEGSQLGVYYANLASYTDDPYMIEGYYEVPINKFLTITPAVIYGNIGDNSADEDNIYGAVRATFRF